VLKELLQNTYLGILDLCVIDNLLIFAVCFPKGPKFLRRVVAEVFVGCVEEALKENVAVGTRVGRANVSVFKCQQFRFVLFSFGGLAFILKTSDRLVKGILK
jgi:hypothetical protein